MMREERTHQMVNQEDLNKEKLDTEEDSFSRMEPLKVVMSQHFDDPLCEGLESCRLGCTTVSIPDSRSLYRRLLLLFAVSLGALRKKLGRS